MADPSAHEYQNTPGSNQRESLRDILMQPTQTRDFAPQFNHHNSQQRLHRVHYVSRSKSVKDDRERRLPNLNKKYYSDLIRSLKWELAKKRRSKLRKGNALLIQDNAPPHGVTMATIEECGLQLLDLSPIPQIKLPHAFFIP